MWDLSLFFASIVVSDQRDQRGRKIWVKIGFIKIKKVRNKLKNRIKPSLFSKNKRRKRGVYNVRF